MTDINFAGHTATHGDLNPQISKTNESQSCKHTCQRQPCNIVITHKKHLLQLNLQNIV